MHLKQESFMYCFTFISIVRSKLLGERKCKQMHNIMFHTIEMQFEHRRNIVDDFYFKL